MKRPTARPRGFTLIELMVAIAVMALLSLISWRGLDAMSRATTQNKARADAVLTLQATLAQWTTDLDGVTALGQTRPIDWDGRVLRLTRRGSDPAVPTMLVVAWTLRTGADGPRWWRWQSAPLTTRGDWQQAWNMATAWAQGGGGAQGAATETALVPLNSWQLYYFRDNVWAPAGALPVNTPATVAAQTPATPATPATPTTVNANAIVTMPNGVRLMLDLPPGDGIAGSLTRDWVKPTVGSQRSG